MSSVYDFSKRSSRSDADVQLSEQGGVRLLHLGGSNVQSAMRLTAPHELELAYTQCMMGFMLFHPSPENILMIGLGGGSLAKFIYRRLPLTKTTVIEIHPEVITVARGYFFLPADDERLQVVIGEGGEYVASHPCSADVLLVDGFDDCRQVPSLCSQDFYNRAREALKKNGVLIVNLLSRDKGFQDYIRRIEHAFPGCVATLTVEAHGNLIVFAFKHSPGKQVWEDLQTRATKLEAELGLPFTRFVRKLHQRKPF
ncbi:polyamine aminopropyltransferase [Nitrosovibrio sp. Nv6]|uniref:polyamine aminopropyltransferase n=1 Tax=Nitrosovibrio sp. Nv6 TaxID=1855340 RepID=UPI0008B18B98|nr:polyamine aminopropyltransferase [Nitrosovibrio sp. Nv6]SEP39003.1 spermidine synthase [Nitrosovibrio sp. Nv6]